MRTLARLATEPTKSSRPVATPRSPMRSSIDDRRRHRRWACAVSTPRAGWFSATAATEKSIALRPSRFARARRRRRSQSFASPREHPQTTGDADLARPLRSMRRPLEELDREARGRTVGQSRRQPTADGGWVETYEDVTEQNPKRGLADERMTLQLLIDQVPDYLWIKDPESRFVVVNKALATDSGFATTSDLVGRSDFDIHPSEAARVFRAREMDSWQAGVRRSTSRRPSSPSRATANGSRRRKRRCATTMAKSSV